MKSKMEKPKLLPAKSDFNNWYSEILKLASLIDTSYPVKGFQVWMPYGWGLRNNVFKILRRLLEESGHKECYFPLLIPESLFNIEKELARGFENEVYWVSTGGIKPLGVKLALRPTSEVPIYSMLSKWIRSYADLPLKLWQLVNTFRYETKSTKPLIRVREISSFKEAHTVHSSKEDAEKQVEEAVNIYKKFFDSLGIPYVISKRPDFDKFPGSEYTYAFDTIFPDGRTLQIGTVHYHGQKFSKAFDITFLNDKGETQFAYSTCYGISERAVAGVIAIHGDDHGLRLPPKIAPIKIVIVPIYAGDNKDKLLKYIEEIKRLLMAEYSIVVDDRDLRPGKKFYEWELKGVPIRLEVGSKEIENKTVTVSRRDNLSKTTIKFEQLKEFFKETLESIENNIFKEAKKKVKSKMYKVSSFFSFNSEDVITKLMDLNTGSFKGGIVEVPVCGDINCELKIANYLTVLGEPLNKRVIEGKCICGKTANKIIRVSRQY
ncbi:MAG: proline--tRNA ligase [Candidatus Odinarchaeia archaeon]